ncbi:probable ribonuclease ZC3H12C [Salmo trutta]|uniref:Probable ribonuclease ZC3H12C n=1 Tax=Salmo trutta TaxID=8032 RepID=A0A674E671_SALTR|nr:probable ribonuclease ZC3H12C [Salmo trutta]XP_029597549.1 probable ribonuclease ZC3H12C [Salmo trutta]XP_029597550.1 probable ribonuclease ZC3H12C [Salmo trutta]XP_029597552.1 probable ribonuclease ZC3H12C [Salmo trutta]XP_029597553.1 probable ribonuclease ZC3H12C [Salmo trutta]XP_029597554.1 probable ribonuclease ZC3H12C [Salmo trutta]XP_029597555.1 probable ribonuclease ZC3H12C [Salmo trutta]XP_029597556.1 probable ribonuclease ZC3H12C [Salmo trutta]
MGLKDHPEEDGAGRILDLGLDLEYLHIEGSVSRKAGADTGPSVERGEEEEEACEGSGSCSLSTPGGKEGEVVGEESAGFDSDPEPARNSTGSNPAGGVSVSELDGGVPVPNTHQPLCRTPCVDLGSEGPPDPPSGEPSPGEALREYQSKLEFALKLGYAEELVRLVLAKLGPYTLINDILGELVKLGRKAETNQQLTGSTASQPGPSSCSSSSSSSTCGYVEAVEAQQGRSDSPYQTDLLLGDKDNLRPVVLDGSNVAMSHGNKEVFSCYGIQLAVDWFLERGHRDITVFVPSWKKEQSRPDALITDQDILRRLEKDKILVFTPSRRVQGRRVVCYDDRFIVKLAYESDGIIVSNDNYRDLASEKPEWKKLIDERLLMYSFVNDKFMPPDDPLGRHGPSLENFLRKRPIMPEHKKQPCPYGKKCTYGHKCKYYHPERSAQCQRSVADELRASAKTSATSTSAKGQAGEAGLVKSHSVPNNVAMGTKRGSAPKRQCDPSIRALSYGEAEDKLRHAEKCNSLSSSSGSSCCSGSVTLSPAPGGPPSSALSDPQEQPPSLGRDTPYMTLPPPHPDPYSSSCDPPDQSYYSVTPVHSGLAARRSPMSRFPLDTDLRLLGSSDCGDSGCDSYGERASCLCCPGPLLDKYIHHQHHQHHQHNRLYSQHSAPLLDPHPSPHTSVLHGYHQSLARGHSFPHHEPPDPHLKRPLYPLPPPLQHQAVGARSSCPGDYPSVSQSGPYPAGSPLGRCLANTRLETLSDSRLYERSPLPPRKAFSWDPYCGQPPQSRYETYQSLPETHDVGWGHTSPWGQTTHSYHPPHPPYPSQPPHPSHAPQPSHPSMPPHHMHQEPPALSRYGEVRGKVYLNLCNIFPSELVGRVMGRNPQVTDAQQLAAAILAEKSGY